MEHARFLLLSAALGLVACFGTPPPPELAGDSLSFALPDLDGVEVRLSDDRFRGRVVLVDIWGTWCDPCQRSVPFLIGLQNGYRDDGLDIVGIAFETESDAETRHVALRRAISEYGINYTVLDGGTTEDVWAAIPDLTTFDGFPSLLLVDRGGRVTYAKTGFFPREKPAIEREVRRALGL